MWNMNESQANLKERIVKMTKQIEDYTADELFAKIEAIKAERERTANALKRYEEELERRKQEAPLGVPLESNLYRGIMETYSFCFTSDESKMIFNRRLNDYVEALRKLVRGEPIDITVLLPLLKKGWVAMDKDGYWYWYDEKPYARQSSWGYNSLCAHLDVFNIKPVENWEESLQECGVKT